MIKVTIELESAVTGETTKIGQMHIWNRGTHKDPKLGNYGVAVCRKGHFNVPFGHPPEAVSRTGEVTNYPRLAYNVWRLIARALKSAFPEESKCKTLTELLRDVRPVTEAELKEQGANLAKNYKPGPRQAVPFMPVLEESK